MKINKKEVIKFKEILTELKILKRVGGVDFVGLESGEGFIVEETINNRLEYPIKIIEDILKENGGLK